MGEAQSGSVLFFFGGFERAKRPLLLSQAWPFLHKSEAQRFLEDSDMLLLCVLFAMALNFGSGALTSTLSPSFFTRFTSSLQSTWEEQMRRFDRHPTLTCELVESGVFNVSIRASDVLVRDSAKLKLGCGKLWAWVEVKATKEGDSA
jgi:hypothetical protein